MARKSFNEIESKFRQVCEDFNRSAFALQLHTAAYPGPYRLLEIEAILDKLPEKGRLLDIGTGPGIIPETVHRFGHDVVSLDFPVSGGTDALKRLTDLGMEGHYTQVGVEPIPLADNSIDVAFAGDVIEHLPHSPKPFLQDILRVLKPGGWIVVATPNAVRLTVRLKVLLGKTNWPPIADYVDEPFHYGHHKEYTMAELLHVVRAAGFVEVEGRHVEDRLNEPKLRRPFDPANGVGVAEAFAEPLTIKAARNAFRLATETRSSLKSSLLVTGQKPGRANSD